MTASHLPGPPPTPAPPVRAPALPRRVLLVVLTLVLAFGALAFGTATPATAATVYEINGEWAPNTPTTVSSGDVVTAEWRVNVNDDQPAPSNDPVDNVTFTVTLENGVFDSLPNACLTAGVTPASSISPDGRTLVCNLGTHREGTAVVVQAPVLAEGPTGSQLTATGSIAGQTAELPPIDIVNPFGMDIRWETGTSYFYSGSGYFEMDLQWTLSKEKGSEAGPQTVTYDLNIASDQGSAIQIAPDQCAPFTARAADGHPWSGGTHPANQTTSFVGSCQIIQTGPNTFQLTLTGIDYDPVAPPTLDSAGNRLPTDEVALASGSIWIRVLTTTPGSVSLTSNAPVYTSPSGATDQDDPANNTESKAWTVIGLFSSGWARGFTNSGGTTWDNTYRVSAGTQVAQYMHTLMQLHSGRADNLPVGMCAALDTRYVTFNSFVFNVPVLGVPGSVVEYYVGNSALLDPASASYDPYTFDCAGAGGWTAIPPVDPTQVKAIRYTMTQGQAEAVADQNIFPYVVVDIRPDTPVGTDVWSFFTAQADNGTWYPRNACVLAIPDARYPCTTGFADVLHIITATPAIAKSADRSVVEPGVPATYTLTYSANGAGAIPDSVDDYTIVDTLPAGMTYVPGSATPEPALSMSGGQQVLTWTIDGVTTNVDHALTYQAVADGSVTPGQTLTNSAVASVGGETSRPATAQVTVSTDGYTTIAKTADSPYVPNLSGEGDGSSSWTVTLRSFDPLPQSFTDTIDVLPYEGDSRGTSFSGSYAIQPVTAVAGATVYYTTAAPGTLSDDPADASNGSAGSVAGNTVGWTTTFTPDATAVRVIGPQLDPGATQQFTVPFTTDGAVGGDAYVNRAQARDEHTRLVMRTSAPITVANYYSAALKKYVQDAYGVWRDANDVADYPSFKIGDTVRYRIVVTNTGQGTLTNIDITDDQFPQGSFHIDSLAPGASQSHEYSMVISGDAVGTLVNTACAEADIPSDSGVPPTINCDPAGRELANYVTSKVADPASGTAMQPGQVINYTIAVTQQGTVPAQAVFTDDLADVLDDAKYNGDATASIGTVEYVDGKLVWSGTVPVGQVASVTYSVTVKGAKKLGNRDLVNPVTSPGCVVKDGQTIDCDTVHEVPKFDLAVDKRVVGGARVTVGEQVRYKIRVSNLGPDVAPAPIKLVDPLPAGLELVKAKGKGWDCKAKRATDVVRCKRDTLLEPGKKAPAVFVVAKTTKAATGKEVVNVAEVSANGDTVKSNNQDVAGIQVTAVPALPGTGFRFGIGGLF